MIEGQRLAYVGPPDETRRSEPYDRVIDAARHVAMPGLVNAHTHTYATLFKGSYELMPLDLWGKGYLTMGILMLVQTTVNVTKTIRDNVESEKLIRKVEDAKTEKLLLNINRNDAS